MVGSSLTQHNTERQSGFTLIEMLVVIVIVVIMTSIGLFNFQGFSRASLVRTTAVDVGFLVRSAQVFGISSPEFSDDIGEDVEETVDPVGVHFDPSASAPDRFTITLFRKGQSNNNFDPFESGDTILEEYVLPSGIEIFEILFNDNTDADGDVSILFQRPEPQPVILDGNNEIPSDHYPVQIILRSQVDTDQDYSIYIEETGLIYSDSGS